eukprot:CAMPEP_0194237846 /NCGR_PEP_ID=MMETSP0158-20130606/4731_1 /TAXON_ID=33649 /ORGANISM="Thalassionema nitzschioides, Strain L26-B" /LENGTH=176 /DNA_ID=CAMNT_0038971967 /DNA_START=804 /DNA_END=1334 /DNA_ORIENTATION=-
MWLPTVILVFAIGVPDVWLSFAGGSWSHLQGLVSAALCLTKSDVRRAVTNFLGCRSHELDTIEDSTWYGNFRRGIKRRASSLILRGRRSSRLDDVIGSDANMASIIFRKLCEMESSTEMSTINNREDTKVSVIDIEQPGSKNSSEENSNDSIDAQMKIKHLSFQIDEISEENRMKI